MDEGGGGRRYVAGDLIRMELALEHAMNLARVFVAFSHERDPLTEFYFETASFPAAEAATAGGVRRSRVRLESPVPPETIPGIYTLTRVNAFSVGGKLSRLREESLGAVLGSSFEVVEEPTQAPSVASLDFLA
jgi:hypothetical protein